MDSRSAAHMGTYLGINLALTLLGLLIPALSGPTLILSWAVSATYLYLMPLRTWLKSRLIVEAVRAPNLYASTVELYGTLEYIKMGSTAIISQQFQGLLFTRTDVSQILRDGIAAIMSLPTYEIAARMPILAMCITYLGIGVIYIYLGRTGFYRRIPA